MMHRPYLPEDGRARVRKSSSAFLAIVMMTIGWVGIVAIAHGQGVPGWPSAGCAGTAIDG